jgi:hypothetical protein
VQPSVKRLKVRSQPLDWMESELSTPPPSDDGRRKRRKVRFADTSATIKDAESLVVSCPLLAPKGSPCTQLAMQLNDLCGMDLCSTLTREAKGKAAESAPGYLGSIDTCAEETFRHSFYQSVDHSKLQPYPLMSMDQVLSNPAENSLSVLDQLKLARNLVIAVLKFHSTPWLPPYFAVNDVAFFQIGPELSTCLQTVHFGTDIVPKARMDIEVVCMDGVETSTDASNMMAVALEDAKLQYGIRNVTLWGLGAILLQIGRWNKIDSAGDVLTIRRLSSQAPLGPRYQQLTKRCLECDFGYGEDLSKPRLQQAVYENLVCELSEMIESLDISA